MKTLQLGWATVVVATLSVAACNRADTQDNARVAALEVKDVAARTSETLADSWLATKIQAQYFADADVKARNILVTARDGVVTLKGRVDNPNAHEQALQIAKNTDGVLYVDDQLALGSSPAQRVDSSSVTPPSNEPVATTGTASSPAAPVAERLNDSGITASIQAKYFLDENIKGRRIDVDTRQGVVTLRGDVASDDERAQALILARTTEGVQRVEDGLTVNITLAQPAEAEKPQAPAVPTRAQAQDAALTTQLQSAFAADRQVKGTAIEITAKDGVVLLEGTVPTMAAKLRALSLARDAQGVLQVVDRLKVSRKGN
jgi:hyperosmotically inducible periplasmic protein